MYDKLRIRMWRLTIAQLALFFFSWGFPLLMALILFSSAGNSHTHLAILGLSWLTFFVMLIIMVIVGGYFTRTLRAVYRLNGKKGWFVTPRELYSAYGVKGLIPGAILLLSLTAFLSIFGVIAMTTSNSIKPSEDIIKLLSDVGIISFIIAIGASIFQRHLLVKQIIGGGWPRASTRHKVITCSVVLLPLVCIVIMFAMFAVAGASLTEHMRQADDDGWRIRRYQWNRLKQYGDGDNHKSVYLFRDMREILPLNEAARIHSEIVYADTAVARAAALVKATEYLAQHDRFSRLISDLLALDEHFFACKMSSDWTEAFNAEAPHLDVLNRAAEIETLAALVAIDAGDGDTAFTHLTNVRRLAGIMSNDLRGVPMYRTASIHSKIVSVTMEALAAKVFTNEQLQWTIDEAELLEYEIKSLYSGAIQYETMMYMNIFKYNPEKNGFNLTNYPHAMRVIFGMPITLIKCSAILDTLNIMRADKDITRPLEYYQAQSVLANVNKAVAARTNWQELGQRFLPENTIIKVFMRVLNLDLARLRSMTIQVAIELYRRDHDGALPATLEVLVPTYLAKLPVDPFTGGTMNYVVGNVRPLDGRAFYGVQVYTSIAQEFLSATNPPMDNTQRSIGGATRRLGAIE